MSDTTIATIKVAIPLLVDNTNYHSLLIHLISDMENASCYYIVEQVAILNRHLAARCYNAAKFNQYFTINELFSQSNEVIFDPKATPELKADAIAAIMELDNCKLCDKGSTLNSMQAIRHAFSNLSQQDIQSIVDAYIKAQYPNLHQVLILKLEASYQHDFELLRFAK